MSHRSRAGLNLMVLLFPLLAGSLAVPGPASAAEPERRWGLGWDGFWGGPMLRWRASTWDVTITGGPNDWKSTEDSRYSDPESEGVPEWSDDKQEGGSVTAFGARRLMAEGRFSLAAQLGAGFDWQNVQRSDRRYYSYESDFSNQNRTTRTRTWTFMAGLRPSCALSRRVTVEFEAGLRVNRTSVRTTDSRWFDLAPDFERTETEARDTDFRTYGHFEWYVLKFVFWL